MMAPMRARARDLAVLLCLVAFPARGAEPYEPVYKQAVELKVAGRHSEAAQKFTEAATLAGQAHGHIWLIAATEWVAAKRGRKALDALAKYRSAGAPMGEGKAVALEAQARVLLPMDQTPQPKPGPPRAPDPQPPEPEPPADLVRIKPGTFTMGSPVSEAGRGKDEMRHRVTISRAFLLGRTEVTQREYQRVMGENPSGNTSSEEHPVENVSWFDAVRYCNKRSLLEGLPTCYRTDGKQVSWPEGVACQGYRLPTESEWEYSARAGQATRFAGSDKAEAVGWVAPDSKTHPVAGKLPNAWGLYDMSGNVWEWVWDWNSSYGIDGIKDPSGPESGQYRVQRGGAWSFFAEKARVANRDCDHPGLRDRSVGFRVARSLPFSLLPFYPVHPVHGRYGKGK